MQRRNLESRRLGGAKISAFDGYRILSGLLLRAPYAPDGSALWSAYATVMGGMGRPATRGRYAGVGLYFDDPSNAPDLHVFLREKESLLEQGALEQHLGPFDFKLEQVFTGAFVPAGRMRPAQGGDSLGCTVPESASGTMACVVTDAVGDRFILGTNHVLAGVNRGRPSVDLMLQPGPADGGTKKDRVGVLHGFKEIQLGGFTANSFDAALGKPDSPTDLVPGVRGIGQIEGAAPGTYRSRVSKRGWRTDATTGVLRYKVSFLMSYSQGDALFEDQYGIVGDRSNFAQEGDSGALVVDERNRGVGMVMGVAQSIDLTLANPLETILRHFAVEPER